MGDIDEHVQSIVDKLLQLPVWDAGRAGNLIWFAIGKEHIVTSQFSGEQRVVGEWALHLQCAWRIISATGIEVASSDMYYPASTEIVKARDDFDWDRQGKNLCDEKLTRLFARHVADPLVVTKAKVEAAGRLELVLGGIYTLELFPASSRPAEQWRLFQPYLETGDAIFTGQGYDNRP